ncbi:peptidoglycan-binding domain-containing protein [Jannaschia rubra]|uniref:His-Xaa-Ser repeat protein HxsA n=1 Tax=Jannaschia rubra TaxID=282197 RepID=A0A0M6XPZ0_9RHOB|nr:peptidoglycan-binding domain-containing protein [Jannaschia rubra]CTQ32231.1 His-Xaa-Ser repeat protein HxsA [Jannaschia rubra]SFG49691.1 Putative peptidoglycan binding domain-containing protein [Jannaschia rubra]
MIRFLPPLLLVACNAADPTAPLTDGEKPPVARPGECYVRTGEDAATDDDSDVIWFEVPCALQDRDPVFIAQVQRALAVRDFYDGPVDGLYGSDTKAAVAGFQRTGGFDNETLSMDAAKALGLIALGRDGV